MNRFGINIISTFGKEYSLTFVARSLADSLQKKGVPISLLSIKTNEQKKRAESKLDAFMVSRVEELEHPVNLYVLPLTLLDSLMVQQPALRAKGKLHVVNLWAEFNRIPIRFAGELIRHDVILTNSAFLASVAAADIPGTHVIHSPLSWPIDTGLAPNRGRFDLPVAGTVFLFTFDADSEVYSLDQSTGKGRKNPFEFIEAFQRAFPRGESGAHLAIRATNIDKPEHAAFLRKLLGIAEADRRVHLIRGEMTFQDVMALTASCDVYVSLHRAEGLGLGMLEAMALGKPVIATAWSGNMSFMDLSSACLVRSRLVALSQDYRYCGEPMPPGTVWAEPIQEDAVAYMRLLHQDAGFRASLGRRARLKYEAHQRSAAEERWIDELFVYCRLFNRLPRVVGKYSTA